MKIAVISPLAAIKKFNICLVCTREMASSPVSKRRPIINNNLIFGVDVIVALVAAGSTESPCTQNGLQFLLIAANKFE